MGKAKGKSLCIFSAKGGVGKSTTALNLAGVFCALDKKVLIIDFDTMGGAIATYLNQPFEKTIYNFVDDYANNRYQGIKSYVTKFNDNIDFLAASKDPRQGSKIASNYIEIVLEKAVYEYDVVLVDTNHMLSEFNVTILDKCDSVLLVLSNDLLDLKNMRNVIRIFKDAEKTNYKVLLNGCINPYKRYYSLYDIKSVIKANVDYVVEPSFYLKSMDNYVADGKILTLEKKMSKVYPRVYKAYLTVCNDLMEQEDEK
ncbi:MAG: AAA family ATPase [Bacilli bacterium]|nr:AAA family ATPase [Bacilli bacterium]